MVQASIRLNITLVRFSSQSFWNYFLKNQLLFRSSRHTPCEVCPSMSPAGSAHKNLPSSPHLPFSKYNAANQRPCSEHHPTPNRHIPSQLFYHNSDRKCRYRRPQICYRVQKSGNGRHAPQPFKTQGKHTYKQCVYRHHGRCGHCKQQDRKHDRHSLSSPQPTERSRS